MNIIPLECGSCGAKLKVKLGGLKPLTEVKCPKCGKTIPVPKTPPTPEAPAAAPAAATPSASAPPPLPATAPVPAPTVPPAEPKKPSTPIVIGTPGKGSSGTITTACPSCKREMKVPAELAGKKVRCKGCGAVIPVPAADAAAPAAASPAAPVTAAPPPPTQPAAPAPTVSAAPAARPAPVAVAPSASTEGADLRARLLSTEAQLAAAERRAQEAENALHDLAGQKALDGVATTRKVAELEAKLAMLQNSKADAVRDLQTEIEGAEKRLADLRDRLARLTAI